MGPLNDRTVTSPSPTSPILAPPGPVSPRTGGVRRLVRWVAQGVSWAFITVTAVVIIAFVLVPRIIGATPYTVLTDSMTGTAPAGSIVVVKPTPFEQLRMGDIITYQLRSGEPTVVTHRVVGIDVVEGETRLRTQGDANPVADAQPVRAEQVKGRVIYHVPWIGYIATALDTTTRTLATKVIGVFLITYAAFLLVRGIRQKRHRSS